MLLTSLALSEAVPPILITLLVVVYVEFDVGLIMVTVGGVISRVIETLDASDTLPAAFRYQA